MNLKNPLPKELLVALFLRHAQEFLEKANVAFAPAQKHLQGSPAFKAKYGVQLSRFLLHFDCGIVKESVGFLRSIVNSSAEMN